MNWPVSVPGLACWTLLVLVSAPVAAHPDIDAARAAVNQGDFRQALTRLRRAEESPSKTEEEVVDMHWYRGFCQHVLGKKADAALSFDQVLELRPLYRPDEYETPPDLQEAFRKRADAWRRDKGVEFGRPVVQGDTLMVPLARHAERVATVAVFVRPHGAAVYKPVVAPVKDEAAAIRLREGELRDWLAGATSIELVLEARMASGAPCARVADAARPLALEVSLPAASPAPQPAPVAAPAPVSPAPAPFPAPVPVVSSPEKPRGLLYGGVAAAVGAGLSAAVTGVAFLGVLASVGLFAGSYYALGSVKGIMVSPQYPLLVGMYQVMPLAAGFAGIGSGLALLCTTGLSVAAALLLWLAFRPA